MSNVGAPCAERHTGLYVAWNARPAHWQRSWSYTARMGSARWLATLRAHKHALLRALLPVFALAVVTAPACAAAMAAPHASVGTHLHDHTHAHDGHSPQPAPESPTPPCSHCPLDAGAANVGHATCTIADGQDGAVALAKDVPQELPLLPVHDWTLPAARAAPPLIVTLPRSPKPLAATVPLNIRHCVFVI